MPLVSVFSLLSREAVSQCDSHHLTAETRTQTIFISIKFLILNKQYCKLFFPFEIMKSNWWICFLPDYVEKVEKEDISPVKMVDSGDTDCDHLPGSCHLPRHGHETWRKWTVMETLIHVSVTYLIISRC